MAEGIGYNDMMRMQSEAVQRVREMQRRAQNAVQKANAQRAGRAHEKSENNGESFKHSAAPSIQQSARATALPLDFITGNQSVSTKTPAHIEPNEKKAEPPDEAERSEAAPPTALTDNLDRLLVVALILLLSQEEADQLLLMALGYLII